MTEAVGRRAREVAVPFRRALREVASMAQARIFFIFMLLSTIFLFLQQAVLEPYGGEVLGLDVRATSAFNAMLTFGILVGIASADRPWAEQMGRLRLARLGLLISITAYALLAWSAASASAPSSWLTLFVLGFGNGVFTVAGLALMMGMASRSYAALFMGAWTVAHALAEGIATATGGVVYEAMRVLTGSIAGGYATVFLMQGVGLVFTLPLLARIDPGRFKQESDALEQRRQVFSDKMS